MLQLSKYSNQSNYLSVIKSKVEIGNLIQITWTLIDYDCVLFQIFLQKVLGAPMNSSPCSEDTTTGDDKNNCTTDAKDTGSARAKMFLVYFME